MDKAQHELVERTLKQLRAKDLPELKSTRRLEAVLVKAHKSGDLDGGELQTAVRDLVEEADVPRYFAADHNGRDSDVGYTNGIALLFLLLLLYLLLAAVPEDSDLQYIIRDLIDKLLGRS